MDIRLPRAILTFSAMAEAIWLIRFVAALLLSADYSGRAGRSAPAGTPRC